MRTLIVLSVACCLLGCSRPKFENVDPKLAAARAEVVVLADLKSSGREDRYVAREVLKGRLGPEFRFKIGEDITPGLYDTYSSVTPSQRADAVLIYYRQNLGVLSCSLILPVKHGRIIAASGAAGDLDAFVASLKNEANQALEPTSTAVTPPADAGDRASGARGSP